MSTIKNWDAQTWVARVREKNEEQVLINATKNFNAGRNQTLSIKLYVLYYMLDFHWLYSCVYMEAFSFPISEKLKAKKFWRNCEMNDRPMLKSASTKLFITADIKNINI